MVLKNQPAIYGNLLENSVDKILTHPFGPDIFYGLPPWKWFEPAVLTLFDSILAKE